nr:hypothetical protein [Tanacetum cinerariifolium]
MVRSIELRKREREFLVSLVKENDKKTVARFLDRVNRALGTGLIEKRVGNVLQQKTEAVRCFGTSIVMEETGSTVRDEGVTGDEHRRSVAVSYDQIRRHVVGEEVVGPGGAEMVVNVSNGVPWKMLRVL